MLTAVYLVVMIVVLHLMKLDPGFKGNQGGCIQSFGPSQITVCSTYMEPPSPRWACRRWHNQSHFGEMLDELQWPELQELWQQASLTFFYKMHNNLVTVDKNRYLSEAGNRRTRSHPFQYHRPNAYTDRLKFSFPGQLQLGMDLQPKLSLRRKLMGLSSKYNDLGLGRDMAWCVCT